MNKDILGGMWKQVKGSVKQTWGELTDDELDQIEGKRDQLAGKLQEKYGYTKLEADRQIDEFLSKTERELKNHE